MIYRTSITARALRKMLVSNEDRWMSVGRDGFSAKKFLASSDGDFEHVARKLQNGSFRFTPYRQLLLSKGAHKPPRVVSVPTIRDRTVLQVLLKVLSTVFSDVVPERSQKKVRRLKVCVETGKYDGYLKVDVKNFYDTISHVALMEKVGRKIRLAELRSLILKSVQTPTLTSASAGRYQLKTRGIPQGLSTSNMLAEIAMLEIDREFSGMSGLDYFRYVDDIVVLCNFNDVVQVLNLLELRLKSVGVEIHPVGPRSKSQYGLLADGFQYLGYEFNSSVISVRKENRERLENRLAKVFSGYEHAVREAKSPTGRARALARCQWNLNIAVTGCIWNGRRQGWLAYFSHLTDFQLLHDLDRRVRKRMQDHHISSFRPKTFVTAYWAINNARTDRVEYVPNFDNLSVQGKREMLELIFNMPAAPGMNDDVVEAHFARLIDRIVIDLEKDIGSFS